MKISLGAMVDTPWLSMPVWFLDIGIVLISTSFTFPWLYSRCGMIKSCFAFFWFFFFR